MSRILELIAHNLDDRSIDALSGAIRADTPTTRCAAASALTVLFGRLRDALTSDVAAEELHRSVVRDHDGQLFEDAPRYFSQSPGDAEEPPEAQDLLGADRAEIEEKLARELGLSPESVHQLTSLMASVVVSGLALHASREQLGPQELANEIVGDAREVWQKEPEAMRALRELCRDGSTGLDASAAVDVGIGAL